MCVLFMCQKNVRYVKNEIVFFLLFFICFACVCQKCQKNWGLSKKKDVCALHLKLGYDTHTLLF